jgi:hypothetical protein
MPGVKQPHLSRTWMLVNGPLLALCMLFVNMACYGTLTAYADLFVVSLLSDGAAGHISIG